MSDQKTEDTKPPVARRGARPFVGPAGAASARPPLRPATPSNRPDRPPFAPPSIAERALGVAPRAVAQPPAAPVAAAPVLSEPLAPPAVPGGPMRPAPVAPLRPTMPTPSFGITAEGPLASLGETIASEASRELTGQRPITTEMMAMDAFDAFESVWGGGRDAVSMPTPVTSPAVDHESLGGGSEAQHEWSDEITDAAAPAVAADVSYTAKASIDTSDVEAEDPPELPMPAWLADDAPSDAVDATPMASAGVHQDIVPEPSAGVSAAQDSGDVYDATDVSAVWPPNVASPDLDADWSSIPTISPVSDDILPAAPAALGAAAPAEPAWNFVTPKHQPVVDPRVLHRERLSSALERLAKRVRTGEIDVSSVAPEATDAAVLASVLAALLGGSNSR